jgi:hypothetical protein
MDTSIKQRPAIAMAKVESSRIHAIGHRPESNTLSVQFKTKTGEPGNVYQYDAFTAEQFDEFKNAESIGSHFEKRIRPFADRHPYVKVS